MQHRSSKEKPSTLPCRIRLPLSSDQSPVCQNFSLMHDALCLLKNSLAMPKLLYILRTSPCANYSLLHKFDRILRAGLESVLNIQLSDEQRKQASLPVHMGGLGIRSAYMLAPSAFLASAAATLPLQEAILSASLPGVDDSAVNNAKQTQVNLRMLLNTSNAHGILTSRWLSTTACSRHDPRPSIRHD